MFAGSGALNTLERFTADRAVAASHTLARISDRIVRMQAFMVGDADVEVGDAFVGDQHLLDPARGVFTEPVRPRA